jgi:hypothetical protein
MAAAGRVPNYLLRTRGREVYLWNQKVGVVLLAKSRTPRCCNDLGIARRIFPADGCLDRRWRRRSGAPKFTRRCLSKWGQGVVCVRRNLHRSYSVFVGVRARFWAVWTLPVYKVWGEMERGMRGTRWRDYKSKICYEEGDRETYANVWHSGRRLDLAN